MLLICQEFCDEFCLNFNAKKSKALLFGQFNHMDVAPLQLYKQPIEYVSNWVYLGTTVVAGKTFAFSHTNDLRSFFRAANSVLTSLQKPNELVLMKILYSMCVPILSYAAEVKYFKSSDMHDCNVALNNAIRRIFSFKRWESPRQLRQSLNFPNLYEIFASRKSCFEKSCSKSSNGIVAFLANKVNTVS